MGCCSSAPVEWADLAEKCPADGVRFHEEVINVNGKRRNVASWLPAEDVSPKAVLFVVHGLVEHSLCYYNVAHAFVRQQYCVFAMDHVSHGKSDGERGVIRDHQDLYNDLVEFINTKRKEYEALPIFMLAHSMGTLAAIMAINRIPDLKAVAFSASPIFAGPASASPFGIRCLHPLTRTSAVRCLTSVTAAVDPRGMAAPLDITAISSDPDELDVIRRDPRRGMSYVTNKTARELLLLIDQVKQEVPRIALPFLCIHGSEDQIALQASSEYIFKNAGTDITQKRLHIFPGLKHECFHELRPQGPESIAMVVDFFNEHYASPTRI